LVNVFKNKTSTGVIQFFIRISLRSLLCFWRLCKEVFILWFSLHYKLFFLFDINRFPSILELFVIVYIFLFFVWSILYFKSKRKSGSDLWHAMKANLSTKFIDNPLRNDKSQTNSVFIEWLIILDKTKESKQLILMLFFNTNSSIDYRYL